jgi:hypothetical protein
MGMKSASFLWGTQLTVISKKKNDGIFLRRWDLDLVSKSNEWRILKNIKPGSKAYNSPLGHNGTIVIIEDLDRMLSLNGCGNIITDNEFYKIIDQTEAHLALVFHRFLENGQLKIYINSQLVKGFNPHFLCEDNNILFNEILKDSSSVETKIKSFIFPRRGFTHPNSAIYQTALWFYSKCR